MQPRDAFISDLIMNRISLKRLRALTESENVARKNPNSKRTVSNTLDKMLRFL
jgi:hypothetical protein